MYSVFEASLFEKVKVGIEPAIGLCRIIAVAWTALKVQYCYEEKNGTLATEYTCVLIYLLRCFWATLRPTLPINHSRMMAGCLDKPMGHLWLSFEVLSYIAHLRYSYIESLPTQLFPRLLWPYIVLAQPP